MTPRPLNAVLRALADAGPPETDAALLKRFATLRDEDAFARLVRRHGRLVWAVCRHLTRSDAEADDAFQATFVVLLRSAGKLKDAGKLSAWLHGVAYKVCGKARQAGQRRAKREAAVAANDRTGPAVPDSAWDRALAAVHEEVAGLPDSLRVPFVMCCLEGVGQTEAAEQLGWKLGTLSGRLTRAKDAVLARLSARGLTLGVLAGVGLAGVPAAVSAKATELASAGGVIPAGILQLSSGVIGMGVHKVKLLAAGVLAACGLAVSGGAGWLQQAGAQSAPPPAQSSPADRVKQLEAELAKAKAEADAATAKALAEYTKALMEKVEAEKGKPLKVADTLHYEAVRVRVKDSATAMTTAKWEYEFVDMAETFDPGNLALFLQEREKAGWEFLGSSALGKNGGVPMWLFRRAKGGAKVVDGPTFQYKYLPLAEGKTPSAVVVPGYPVAPKAETPKPPAQGGLYDPKAVLGLPTVADDPKALEAEIKRLQKKLEDLKANPKPQPNPPTPPAPPVPPLPAKPAKEPTLSLGFGEDKLPLKPDGTATLLRALADKKFGAGVVVVEVDGKTVLVHGSKEAVEWAKELVDGLRK